MYNSDLHLRPDAYLICILTIYAIEKFLYRYTYYIEFRLFKLLRCQINNLKEVELKVLILLSV